MLGHAAIAKRSAAGVGVATGEHCANRVIFKQLLQADAIDFCQIDSCRLGGVNENLAVILMAAKFGVPVCPHAGGVGLCEYVPAPVDVRLHRGHRHDGGPRDRVRRSPARALRGSGRHPERALHAAGRPGYSITIKPLTAQQVRIPRGTGMPWPQQARSISFCSVGIGVDMPDDLFPRIAALKTAAAFASTSRATRIRSTSTISCCRRRSRRWRSRSSWTACGSATASACCRWKGGTGRPTARPSELTHPAVAQLRPGRREADLGWGSRRGPARRPRQSESAAADAGEPEVDRRSARHADRRAPRAVRRATPTATCSSACS